LHAPVVLGRGLYCQKWSVVTIAGRKNTVHFLDCTVKMLLLSANLHFLWFWKNAVRIIVNSWKAQCKKLLLKLAFTRKTKNSLY